MSLRMYAMDNIKDFKKAFLGYEAGYGDKCGTSKNLGAAALAVSERYKVSAQIAKAVGMKKTASLALVLEDMGSGVCAGMGTKVVGVRKK